ncbi:MAG: hypothetical protein Q9182_005877 [Xanthomendoza sp. 2 TL-2023]
MAMKNTSNTSLTRFCNTKSTVQGRSSPPHHNWQHRLGHPSKIRLALVGETIVGIGQQSGGNVYVF